MNTYFAHGPFVGMFGFGPLGSVIGAGAFFTLAIVFVFWSLFWAGLGLWHAARNRQLGWFIAILLIHTLGILEIIYLFGFRKDRGATPLFGDKNHTAPPPVTPPMSSSSSV